VDLDPEMVPAQDVVVILTPHPELDMHALVNRATLVFDTRGVTSGLDAPNVSRL